MSRTGYSAYAAGGPSYVVGSSATGAIGTTAGMTPVAWPVCCCVPRAASSAAMNSSASANRRCGSFSSARITTASSSGETAPL